VRKWNLGRNQLTSLEKNSERQFFTFEKPATMRACIILFILTSAMACRQQKPGQEPETLFTKGVYGNPATLLNAGYSFDSLGMNAVFVRSASLHQQLVDTARKQGCKIYVEFPTLNGKEYLQDHPDAWPINEAGEAAQAADWFMGICPTHPGFKEHRFNQLRDLLTQYEIDGIFLDYFHWHAQFETPEPVLPETCFCDRCTTLFSEHAHVVVPGKDIPEKAQWILTHSDIEWRAWRNHVLNSWADDLRAILHEQQPNAVLGVYYCAWFPDDHGGALYRTLGIDVAGLAQHADVLAPMLYHRMMDRPPSWVSDYMTWLNELIQTGTKVTPLIWPIVQAHNKPGIITPEEFRQVMLNGSRPPASGIMMFSDHSLIEDPEKLSVMVELYRGGFR
jgi:hypothetical protein